MSKKDIRDIIKEQLNKPDGNVEVAEVVEIVPNQMDGEGDDKFLNPPVSFGEQMAETFGLLPREWRVFLTNHEAENEQKLKDLSSQVDAFAWVSQLAEPRQERFKKYGFEDAKAWLKALAEVDDLFEKAPAEGVKFLADAYGVKINAVPDVPVVDTHPMMRSLAEKIDRLEAECNQLKKVSAMRENQLANSLLMNFLQAKDENGQPKHKYFSLVKDVMFALLNARLAFDYEDAYQQSLWLVPQLRAQLIDAQMNKNLKAKAEEAQKAQKAAFEAKGKVGSSSEEKLSTRQILERVIGA